MENITFERGKKLVFYLEPEALPGVKKTAEKVAQDFEKVCGAKPEIVETVCEEETVIFAATVGHSSLLEEMERQGRLDLADVRGKWEVFSISDMEKVRLTDRALVGGVRLSFRLLAGQSVQRWGGVLMFDMAYQLFF